MADDKAVYCRDALGREYDYFILTLKGSRRSEVVTLSQVSVPFSNRTTGMMKARIGPGACREEEQVH